MSITPGTMTVGIMAILAGLVGAYVLRVSLAPEKVEPVAEQFVEVPLASIDLPAGRTILLGDIGLTRMTLKEQIAKKLRDPKVMMSPEQIIGRTLREAIKQGKPFFTTQLYLDGTGPDISGLLPEGMRAVNVTIADRGEVMPAAKDTVDVVFRSEADEDRTSGLDIPEATITLLEGVLVLRVDQPAPQLAQRRDSSNLDIRRGGPPAPPPTTVTLAVTLPQANILKTAEGRGELSLVVRSREEAGTSASGKNRKLTLEDLLGLEPPPAPVAPFITEIYRRGARTTHEFEMGRMRRAADDEGATEPELQPADESVESN